jgi:predicted amidohydrolase
MSQDTVRVAAVQMQPMILDTDRNVARCLELTRLAAGEGARLIVLPECALSGYAFSSLEEALPCCETIPGVSTGRLAELCRQLAVHVVIGMLERSSGRCYNAAVLLGPSGLIGTYRKTHLPYLGVDRFLEKGESPPSVFETGIGRIGMGICYDIMFPEHARVLALGGADVLALPTNWPEQREHIPEHAVPARAAENRMFVVAANRVGIERGTRFLGTSVIAHCAKGAILARGKENEEELLYADLNLAEAREKHVVIAPGEFEFNLIQDRRPELYGSIVDPPAES